MYKLRHRGVASQINPVKRCWMAAIRGQLVLKVDFGQSLAFCDAAYPPDNLLLHEIVYWGRAELDEEPDLFARIIQSAVALNAQIIYTLARR